ncbi:hemolysin XhlA family protein [Clostridium perfringens]|uniref:hemolysin XhlA family protein n=1 Tax=Clostridium perfringens TaxID=1502 RepID=UPI002A2F7334|nr:hemolysin XhlA family protein [Clostridium perfringens]MDM0725010.1 hemolysin XhlA family protein [Clostridium perfringens]
MNEELIEHRMEKAENKLDEHDSRIDALERNDAKKEVQISNLIKSIDTLITVLKIFTTVFGGAIVGFFFYAIQSHIFK